MGSRNFKVNVIIRLVLIFLVMGLTFYLLFVSNYYLRGSYFVILLIFQAVELFRYVDKTNRDLSNFFLSIKERDFSSRYRKDGKGGSFEVLYESMNLITREFETLSVEREVQFNFLSMLVQHLNVGILSFDQIGKIHLMNPALEQLINQPSAPRLEDMQIDPNFKALLREIKPGEKKLFPLTLDNSLIQLAIHASEFRLDNHYYKLISVQNVKNELENNELEAWQKLIRVLTHEIMNSAAPITSLTDTLIEMVGAKGQVIGDENVRDNLSRGLDAIKNRSAGLHTFTQAYQALTKLPTPVFQPVKSEEFVSPVITLIKADLPKGSELVLENNAPARTLLIDKELMSQVLINLVKNALESNQGTNVRVEVIVQDYQSGTQIEVRDNGPGIPEEIREKIFVPFFTTKAGGSGIGLALSRQIVHLHNGTLSYSSDKEGTSFQLKF